MHEKDLHISRLLDFYKDMLSENKRAVMQLYYYDDYSLSEISEQVGITRQGVRDSIKKSERQLFELEDKLGLVKHLSKTESAVSSCTARLREIIVSEDMSAEHRFALSEIAEELDKAMNDLLM
jgi:hypothetical protein